VSGGQLLCLPFQAVNCPQDIYRIHSQKKTEYDVIGKVMSKVWTNVGPARGSQFFQSSKINYEEKKSKIHKKKGEKSPYVVNEYPTQVQNYLYSTQHKITRFDEF
jgi:hypothetical protein